MGTQLISLECVERYLETLQSNLTSKGTEICKLCYPEITCAFLLPIKFRVSLIKTLIEIIRILNVTMSVGRKEGWTDGRMGSGQNEMHHFFSSKQIFHKSVLFAFRRRT